MSDPIKAALDAAAVALVAEGVEAILPGQGRREEWLEQPPTTEARRQAAVTIAAFLRVLGQDEDYGWEIPGNLCDAVEAKIAVQRAGGGDAA
ncbi:hypothetical protein UFOVP747_37 [uncultured Caudovirales phage]|uniref:Uncharacterized protein n=1 Tax=uncultured Caudovirales phage TaxID=2100421 RepID=A0A6J5NP27_9CAUD|nr:hypothetical protein UFOVP675_62 [uncultured Caudovirales phage]CAB5225496.1 hypothetical protein UFOVP747_37 [uncultured Caudovirales phage]